jgi:hypothetical protein
VSTEEAPGHSESERLRRKIELVLPELVAAGRRLFANPSIEDLYPEYLFASHCIVRASVPLMEASLRESRSMARTDPVAARLAEYLQRHIHDEKHHDEWLLDDLEILGFNRLTVQARPPSPRVAALVGSQYYWVFHYHPVALLGYVELLEGYPPSMAEIEDLITRTGHSRRAFRTLIHHARLDPDHAEDLNRTLDELPLTVEQSAAVGLSALSSVHLFARAIDEIVDEDDAVAQASS